MEIYVTASREQQLLFRQIVDDAASRASAMLALPHEAARLRAVSHQGLTPIDQLELSPLAEDQLLAAALRLYPGAARRRTAAPFHNPAGLACRGGAAPCSLGRCRRTRPAD